MSIATENSFSVDSARVETTRANKKIPLVECFGPTIQGEGVMIGTRTAFLRFGLCDYKCTFCDSMHAVDPHKVHANAKWLTQDEIMDRLILAMHNVHKRPNCNWVTFSGGNPCIHDLTPLVDMCNANQINIAVETQGTFCPDWLYGCDVVTVSPKTPGIGERFERDKFEVFLKKFHPVSSPHLTIKLVVFGAHDLEFVRDINDMCCEYGHQDRVYLSQGNPYPPGKDAELSKIALRHQLMENFGNLVEDYLQIPDLANVKILPQLHVLIWGNKQGV